MIYLNTNNNVIAVDQLFVGGVGAVIVDPRVVFKKGVSYLATSIILGHYHPSGNLTPSQADSDLTSKLKEGGSPDG